MKREIRPLRLQRETLRSLLPEELERAAGGFGEPNRTDDTFHNSCNPADASRPRLLCLSGLQTFC